MKNKIFNKFDNRIRNYKKKRQRRHFEDTFLLRRNTNLKKLEETFEIQKIKKTKETNKQTNIIQISEKLRGENKQLKTSIS